MYELWLPLFKILICTRFFVFFCNSPLCKWQQAGSNQWPLSKVIIDKREEFLISMNCMAWGSPQEFKFPFPGDGKLVDEDKFTNIER
jgi:hypothetical protein